MRFKGSKVKMKIKVKIFIDGEWIDGDEIITRLEKAQQLLVIEVYKTQMAKALHKTDAVQWTADALRMDPRTVWRYLTEAELSPKSEENPT